MTPRAKRRRTDILAYILSYQKQFGYSPSVGEMAKELHTVKSNVHYHLQSLEQDGQLTHYPGRARSWNVVSREAL